MRKMNIEVNNGELLTYLKGLDNRYFSNCVTQICTYLKSNNFHKLVFDYDIETVYHLINYFELKEEYKVCDHLQKMITKHNELTNQEYSILK